MEELSVTVESKGKELDVSVKPKTLTLELLQSEYIYGNLSSKDIRLKYKCNPKEYHSLYMKAYRGGMLKQRDKYIKKRSQKLEARAIEAEWEEVKHIRQARKNILDYAKFKEKDGKLIPPTSLAIKSYESMMGTAIDLGKYERLLLDQSTDNIAMTEKKRIIQELVRESRR